MKDVIICLGQGFFEIKNIENMKSRIKLVERLLNQGKAKKVIFTGGDPSEKGFSEAEFMKNLALKNNIHRSKIILEERANTTIGNAVYSNKLMDKNNFYSAIVISSPFHMKRVRYLFNRIMFDKELEFKTHKSNLNFTENLFYFFKENWALFRMMLKGIDYQRT